MALLQEASASASSTYSPSSSSSPPWRYQVFLSFRGKDTRNNFIAHLYRALVQKGINTYMDNNLERGEKISPALFEAIEGSKSSIIILSPHYASSTWCLKELVKILECKETKQQIVLPVFYQVDPSDVRHQRNTFEEAFAEHEGWFKDDKKKVQRWKAALTEVSNLSGFHLKKDGNESEFINEIIQWVEKSITHTSLGVAKYPMGIQYGVQCIRSILRVGMNDKHVEGILGSVGIDKTLIANAIYNLITDQFKATFFLPDVRETSAGERGLVKLQETYDHSGSQALIRETSTGERGLVKLQETYDHSGPQAIIRETSAGECGLVKLQETYDHSGSQALITKRGKGSCKNTREGWDKSREKGCKITCFYCKQEGHIKRNCRKYKTEKGKSS